MKRITCCLSAAALLFSLASCSRNIIPSINDTTTKSVSYTVIAEPQFENAQKFSEGYAAVSVNGKWGFIDERGEIIIEPQFDFAFSFSEGRALVGNEIFTDSESGYWLALIDSDSNIYPLESDTEMQIFNVDFDSCLQSGINIGLQNGYLYICHDYEGTLGNIYDRNGKLAMTEIDSAEGKLIMDKDYYISNDYSDGLIQVHGAINSNREPYIDFYDKAGNRVVSFDSLEYYIYEGKPNPMPEFLVYYASPYTNGYSCASVLLKEDIDKFFDEGFFSSDNDYLKFALLDKQGDIAFIGDYLYINYASSDECDEKKIYDYDILTLCEIQSEKWGIKNMNNDVIIPFEYDFLGLLSEGLIPAKKDGLYGYIDLDGNTVIDYQFDSASSFSNGVALAVKNGKSVVIDPSGVPIKGSENIPFQFKLYDDDFNIPNSIDTVIENGEYGYIKLTL